MPMREYQIWHDADGAMLCESADLAAPHGQHALQSMSKDAALLCRFEAATGEEARAIYHLRMGWGAFTPLGDAQDCPTCGAKYYPQGSAQCWRCG